MRRVKTDRSLVMYVLLSILTCGLYGYYFIYKLAEDVNLVCAGDGKRTRGLLGYLVLSALTCGLYSIYWMYTIGNRLQDNAFVYDLQLKENGTTILMWFIVGSLLCGIGPLVAMYFLIKNMNIMALGFNKFYGL